MSSLITCFPPSDLPHLSIKEFNQVVGDGSFEPHHRISSRVLVFDRYIFISIRSSNNWLGEDLNPLMKPFVNQSHERASDVCYKFKNSYAKSIAAECGFHQSNQSDKVLSILFVLSFGQLFFFQKRSDVYYYYLWKILYYDKLFHQSETSKKKNGIKSEGIEWTEWRQWARDSVS